ncbi:MAG: hypothetical protein FJ086_08005, partial [Deltaproteobacteria bacterium]|nr:hypothetical protein [Deltaproteobacteria bacterium]
MTEASSRPAGWRGGLRAESFLELWRAVDPSTGRVDAATAARVQGCHFVVSPAWDFLGDVGGLASGEPGPQSTVHALLLSDLLDRAVVREVPPLGIWCAAVVAALLAALGA